MTRAGTPTGRRNSAMSCSVAGLHGGFAFPPGEGALTDIADRLDRTAADAATDPWLTVIVPTRNERDNVAPLLGRLGPAMAPVGAEIIVVDDSDDDTPAQFRRHAAACPVPISLLHRPPSRRRGGLGTAVLAAARHARGAWILVMDADLQHPPEAAALVARAARRHDVDVVIGTRYAGAGSGAGLDGFGRVFASSSLTRLTRAVFPRRLATISDPMSGLFAFRVAAIDVDRLNPTGLKILLEVLVRHPTARVAEVAYEMDVRHAGTSNTSLRAGLTFLRHLVRLRRARLIGQLRSRPQSTMEHVHQLGRMIAFGLVGVSGIAVNTAVLWLLYEVVGLHHLLGAALATQASTAWNFALIAALVYRGKGNGTWQSRAVRFALMNNLLLLARLPVMQVLIWAGVGVLVANGVTLVLLFLVRFFVSDRVIFARTAQEAGRPPVRVLIDVDAVDRLGKRTPHRSRYLTYRYDVAGLVTIGSQIRLPELEFFRAQWVSDTEVDLALRVGDVGARRPRRRAALTEYGDPVVLRYEEHLGRHGANFRVELGEPITVTVGPLLARSPHVVYTNIVEALLRFVLVSRGRMLLHSACVTLDGVGLMLSALTDTGKTATVLRLLREHGGHFLSDDMTVVDATGTAVCFPKPLTISAHTLRAVRATDLTPGEWRRLRLQSRVHSKGGRSIALALSRFNVPIMGINAVAQILVPPPKYCVDRLVQCRLGSSTRVSELFVIERGAPRVAELDRAGTLDRMIRNTDDAYGFPPFQYLAPSITIGGEGYQQLRERERRILAGFLSHVHTRVVASDNFGWAEVISGLVADGAAGVEPTWESDVDGTTRAWPRWDLRLATANRPG
jgi:dolichol-phosphate mannosyltransferase